MDISPNDQKVLEQFRKGAVDVLPDGEKKTLWRRIERSIGKRIYLPVYFKWAAAASIALLLSIGYLWYNNDSAANIQMLIVETQPQQKQKLTLPDSTVVWLNAGSRIEYPENFMDHRLVCLEGEAYFDVTHHDSHPFTVRAFGLDVTVLGTIFNVTAYKSENEVITTLVEGEIALQFEGNHSQQTILTPNQQVVFNKESNDLRFAAVDPEWFTSWVKGYYKFENVSFEQIAKYFERVYGVVIHFEDESLETLLFTGTFLHSQRMDTVLELLREISDFHFTIQGNQIKISQSYINSINH